MDQPDNLRLVRLSGADGDRLYRFYTALEPEVVRFYQPYGPDPTREKIDAALAAADASSDVAYGVESPEGEIVGHVFIAGLASGSPTFGIGLSARVHGRGWGRRLAETVLAEADAANLPLVTLTVVKANARALSLYRSVGFEHAGECTFRTEGDSFVMHRRRP